MISNDIAQNQEIARFKSQVAALEQLLEVYEQTTLEQSDRLEQALQALTKRAAELETVARVSAAASTILESVKLLQVVANLTKSSFGLYHAHVYLLNEAGDTLKLAAGAGKVGQQMVAQGWSIPLAREQSLVARAARTRQGVIVNNVREAPDWLPNPLLPNTYSELAVPVIVGDHLLGVLDVQSDKPGYFTEEDVRIQTTLAAQIAVALQNAKSYEQSRVALAETRMLYDISARLNTAKSLEAVLEAAVSPGILAGANSAGIWLFEAGPTGQPEWMEATATWVREGEPPLPRGTRLRLVDFPSHKTWVNDTGQPTFVGDIKSDQRLDDQLRAIFTRLGIQATAFMPLIVGDRWVGITIISWQSPHVFTTSEQQLYQSTATQAAIAIENQHLFAQTQAALAEVQQSQQLLRSAIDATPDWMIIKDREHRFRLVNQGFANSMHLTPEDLIGKTELDLGFPEDRIKGNPEKGIRGSWTDDLEVMHNNQPVFIPEEPIVTDGQLRFFSTSKVPLQDAQGEVWGMLAFVHDITERKRTEEALQESQQFYQSLVDLMPQKLLRKDRRGRITFANQSYLNSVGITMAEMHGKTNYDLYPPENADKYTADDEYVMTTGETINVVESHWEPATNQNLYVEVVKHPVKDATGNIVGMQIIFWDVTDRKRAEKALARQATELQTVAQVGIATSTILDTRQLLQQVVDLTKSHFELYHTHIYLLNEAGDTLQLAAGVGEVGRRMVAQGWNIPLDRTQSLVAQAARSRQGVMVNNVQATSGFMPNPLLPETRSELAVPMIIGDQVLGVLDVQSDQVDHFSEEDINIQTTLAAQVAVALQNARSFAEQERANLTIKKRVKELNCLNEIGHEIAETPPIPEFLQWVTERIPLAMQYPKMCMTAIEYDGQVYGISQAIASPYQIVHALRIENRVIGRVYIAYTGKYEFLDEESALIGGIAGRVSGYIESRRLVEQTQTALAEVRQSQQFLRTLLDNIPNPVFYKNTQGAYLGFNRAFLEVFGQTEEELLGKTVYDLNTNKELADHYHEKDLVLFRNPGTQVYEASVKYADGTAHEVIYSKATFTNPDGSLGGLVGAIVDITEHKRAEEAWRQSEIRYRTLTQNLPVGVYRNLPGPRGKFLMVNEAMAHMFGYDSPEDLMQYHPVDLYPDPAQRKVFSDKLLTQGQVINEEMEFKRKDGTRLWVAMTATAVRDETGQVAYFDGIIEDITERKQAEEALRASQERFALAVAGTQDGIWDWDIKNNTLYWSPRLKEMLGYKPDELEINFDVFASLLHPEDAKTTDAALEAHLKQQAPYDVEQRLQSKSGEYIWCRVRGQAIWNEAGQPIRMTGSTTDITANKAAVVERERLLAEAQAAYRQYVQREWQQFLSEQPQSQLRIEHQQKAAGSISSNEELVKVQAEVAREGKAKVIATHNGDLTQPAIVAPIALRGQVIGTLSLQDIDPDRSWTAEEKALVETVSEQLALTVENLRLFDDTQKRAMREQMTRQITDKMRAAPDIDSIVRTGLTELAKALNISRAYVKLMTGPGAEEQKKPR